MDVDALVVFTDVRGFTTWAEANEVFANLNSFAQDFRSLIRREFPENEFFVKGLGDGAMIVRELEEPQTSASIKKLLRDTLKRIQLSKDGFKKLCESFGARIGHATELSLGWGVVRGKIKKTEGDYIGHNLNRSARLCDIARPHGVVIDRDDFVDQPPPEPFKFLPQSRRLKGIAAPLNVWVTEQIATQFASREEIRHGPEVHVAGMCVDHTGRGTKILIAKRSDQRRLYRGLIEGCGGQLAFSETFVEGVMRHFRQEMGIEVRVREDIHCFYVIREPNEPVIPGIRFLCERVDEKEPESKNHEWVKWVSEIELRNTPAEQFIPGVKDDFLALLKLYAKKK